MYMSTYEIMNAFVFVCSFFIRYLAVAVGTRCFVRGVKHDQQHTCL